MPGQNTNKSGVRTSEQFAAITSPVRDQILQVVVNQASALSAEPEGVSIREIGLQLGRKPGSLYRHIDELVRVGLLIPCGPRPSGGRDAQAYRAPAAPTVLVTPDRRGPELEALCQYIERAGVHAGRESAAATRDRVARSEESGATTDDRAPDHGMVVMFGWLDAEQRAALRRAMHDIAKVFENAHRRPGTRLVATSLFTRPVRLPGGESHGRAPG
jgi:hypothetical protein